MKAISTLFYIFACSVASVVSIKSPLISTKDYNWFLETAEGPCSEPCGGGYRNATYRCVEYDDPTGKTSEVPDEECSHVPLPPSEIPCNDKPCGKGTKGIRVPRTASEMKRYEWLFQGQWSHCINACFRGKQCRLQGCYDNTKDEWVDDSFCKDLKRPRAICQVCREINSCPPLWTSSGWTACSRSCGRGTRTRSISCMKYVNEQSSYRVENSECKGKKPHQIETCAVEKCTPKYITSKWSQCKGATSYNCGKGRKTRRVVCAGLNKKGFMEQYPRIVCHRLHGSDAFPAAWQICRDYKVPLSKECKENKRKSRVYIYSNNATVVQMRRSRRMTLQVGETGYVFPNTNIIIKCPASGIDARDLLWSHNSRKVNVNGRRIHMNFRGRLKIKHLKPGDLGSWSCIARNESATSHLKLRYPSDGFLEYAMRLPLLSVEPGGMVSDEGSSEFTTHTVQWVADSWSECSSTCGREGVMYRKVRCENIKKNFYKVYDDSVCIKEKLSKPAEKKTCGGMTKCPEWKIRSGPGVCTDACVGVGRALLKDKVYCSAFGRSLPKESCDINKKPKGLDHCNNAACKPKWKVSSWSGCSRSCGGQGWSSRHLQCVWEKSGEVAGNHCYKQKLPQPKVVKPCQTPACYLACVDISNYCSDLLARLCRYKVYQRQCCHSCVEAIKARRKV